MKSNKIVIILAILLIGCISGLIFFLYTNTNLRNELASVLNDNQSLNNQLTTNADKLSESETTITTLETTISELQIANSELEITISELQGNIYDLEAEILWLEHSEELDTNWETFREAYASERMDGKDKQEAYETVYNMFKKQPQQQTQTETPKKETPKQDTTPSQPSTQTPPPTDEGQPNVPSKEFLDSIGAPSGFTWDGNFDQPNGGSGTVGAAE